MILINVNNPVNTHISTDGKNASEVEALLDMEKYMRWHVKNYRFMPLYKAKFWDGKVAFYKYDEGKILTGLVPLALRFLATKKNISVEYKDDYKFFNTHRYDIDPEMFKNYGITLYDDQVYALECLLKHKRGVAELATSFGKSLLCAAMCKILKEQCENVNRTLLIVPTIDLINQTGKDIADVGINTSLFYGHEKSLDGDVIVATWQSLQHILKDEDSDMLESFDAIIIDEVHGAASDTEDKTIKKIADQCVNAVYRYGVTGTMPKDKAGYNSIRGILGDVLIKIEAHELQEIGRLTRCKVLINKLKYSKDFSKGLNKFVKEDKRVLLAKTEKTRKLAIRNVKLDYLSQCDERLDHIAKIADNNSTTIIIVNNKTEGKAIEDRIKDSIFVNEKTPAKERKVIYDAMRNGQLKVLIGTYGLISTGLNIPTIKYVIFASPSRSFIRVIQAIGRSLRKHEDKNMAYIIDIFDQLSGFSGSANERKSFYEEKKYPTIDIDVELM